MIKWPKQSARDVFYGNPRGANGEVNAVWVAKNLVYLAPPFKMTYAGKPVKKFLVHKKCADSLARIFATLAKNGQEKLDAWGVSIFGGCFNFRLSRNSNNISCHAYGCAIDLAPNKFPNRQSTKRFNQAVVAAFANEGWINLKNDPMHFQAAIL